MRLRCLMVAGAMLMGLIAPGRAAAQDAWQGFVGGLGGVTFGTVTSAAVAGQGGARIAPGVFLVGEVGYMRNVLPKQLRDDFQDLVDVFQLEFGVPVTIDVSVPALYGFGGLRWVPRQGPVSPFVEGGVGVAHISIKVDEAEVLGVDIRDIVEDELGDDTNATKFLVALGGGLTARVAEAVGIDFGFRYSRVATDDPAINSAMLYAAVKAGF